MFLASLALAAAALTATPATAHPCPGASLPDLSRLAYSAPAVTGTRIASYSDEALQLMQYARRGYYGEGWVLKEVRNLDALELAVLTDLIAEGYGFRSLSRAPDAYAMQMDEVYRRLGAKAAPLGLRYARVPAWETYGSTSRPGLRIIAAMLKG